MSDFAYVSSCPRTEVEFFQASKRIGCGNDINGHNQYICIPNEEKTSLVELCYNEVMGIREKGNCLEATVGKVIEHSCQNFVSGCPNETFFDYGFYNYPACQNINTKDNCYVMDRSCPPVLPDGNRSTNSDDTLVYVGSSLGGVIVLLIAVLIIIIIQRRRKKCYCFPAKEKEDGGTAPPNGEGKELIAQDTRKAKKNEDVDTELIAQDTRKAPPNGEEKAKKKDMVIQITNIQDKGRRNTVK